MDFLASASALECSSWILISLWLLLLCNWSLSGSLSAEQGFFSSALVLILTLHQSNPITLTVSQMSGKVTLVKRDRYDVVALLQQVRTTEHWTGRDTSSQSLLPQITCLPHHCPPPCDVVQVARQQQEQCGRRTWTITITHLCQVIRQQQFSFSRQK